MNKIKACTYRKSQEKRGFTNTRVTNKKYLEEIVAIEKIHINYFAFNPQILTIQCSYFLILIKIMVKII